MSGVIGSIAALLAWVVIIMMQVQMAELKKRVQKLEEGHRS